MEEELVHARPLGYQGLVAGLPPGRVSRGGGGG
jgi:hypothetical protein